MAYSQGTITDANSAQAFETIVDGLLTSAGWSLLETLTPSGSLRNSVYRSSGLSNLCGYDWFVMVSWTTIGSENYFEVWCGDTYNSGTHILSGIVGARMNQTDPTQGPLVDLNGHSSGSTLNASTYSVSSSKGAISYSIGAGNIPVSPGFLQLLPSSAFGYWASVTRDHIAIFTTVSGGQNAGYSTLLLDSGYAASSHYNHTPIVVFDTNEFSLSSDFIGNGTYTVGVNSTFSGVFGAKLPVLSDDFFVAYAWLPYVLLNYMATGSGGPSTQILGDVVVGHAPDLYLVYGGSIGDTVTFDSGTYVLSGRLVAELSANGPTLAVLTA